jgi:hypothetical protein
MMLMMLMMLMLMMFMSKTFNSKSIDLDQSVTWKTLNSIAYSCRILIFLKIGAIYLVNLTKIAHILNNPNLHTVSSTEVLVTEFQVQPAAFSAFYKFFMT